MYFTFYEISRNRKSFIFYETTLRDIGTQEWVYFYVLMLTDVLQPIVRPLPCILGGYLKKGK